MGPEHGGLPWEGRGGHPSMNDFFREPALQAAKSQVLRESDSSASLNLALARRSLRVQSPRNSGGPHPCPSFPSRSHKTVSSSDATRTRAAPLTFEVSHRLLKLKGSASPDPGFGNRHLRMKKVILFLYGNVEQKGDPQPLTQYQTACRAPWRAQDGEEVPRG